MIWAAIFTELLVIQRRKLEKAQLLFLIYLQLAEPSPFYWQILKDLAKNTSILYRVLKNTLFLGSKNPFIASYLRQQLRIQTIAFSRRMKWRINYSVCCGRLFQLRQIPRVRLPVTFLAAIC